MAKSIDKPQIKSIITLACWEVSILGFKYYKNIFEDKIFLNSIKKHQIYTWHFVILFNWLNGLNTAWYRSQLTAASDHISAKAPTDEQNPYILQPKRLIERLIIMYIKRIQKKLLLVWFKIVLSILTQSSQERRSL